MGVRYLLFELSQLGYDIAYSFRDLFQTLMYDPITEYRFIGRLLELFGVPGDTTLVEVFFIVGLPLIIVYSIVKWFTDLILG